MSDGRDVRVISRLIGFRFNRQPHGGVIGQHLIDRFDGVGNIGQDRAEGRGGDGSRKLKFGERERRGRKGEEGRGRERKRASKS